MIGVQACHLNDLKNENELPRRTVSDLTLDNKQTLNGPPRETAPFP